jgi:hypothetical protein
MTLEYQLKSIDDLSDDVKKMYTEKDGAFVLDVSGLDIPDVSGLKSALDKERDRANAAEKAAKDAAKKRREADDEAARKAGDIKKVEDNLREHYKGELESRDNKIAVRDKKLSNVLIRDEARRIATSLAVNTDCVPLLAEYIERRIGIQDDDDEFNVVVVGEHAGLSMKEFVDQIKQDKSLANVLKAGDGTGGGTTGGQGAGSTSKVVDLNSTPNERRDNIKQKYNL